ncbi:16179_t:CDS:2, partial [Racocetra fulgida]
MGKKLMAKLSELARNEIVEEDLNDEINNFFQSPSEQRSTDSIKSSPEQRSTNPIKRRRRSEITSDERGTSNEADNKKDKLKEFQESHAKMKQDKKWVLSNGKCVEDIIFKHCRQLPIETYLHSWIIDLDDREAETLFNVEEWNEIRHSVRELPQVQTKDELRQILKTTSFLNEGELYNRETHYDAEARTRHKKLERKKMGYRMDEYGVMEVAKKFEATKLLSDGYKIGKVMHDTFICLSQKVHFEEARVRKLRVVGMLHLGLKAQVLHLSSPKGYVSILKREKLLEVPAKIDRIKDLIRVLANVWILKRVVMDCVETVNMKTQNHADFLQEIIGMAKLVRYGCEINFYN